MYKQKRFECQIWTFFNKFKSLTEWKIRTRNPLLLILDPIICHSLEPRTNKNIVSLKMAKDLTNSDLDRKNILNNNIVIQSYINKWFLGLNMMVNSIYQTTTCGIFWSWHTNNWKDCWKPWDEIVESGYEIYSGIKKISRIR